MMRPPRGSCAFMILIASCVQRNKPVRLVSTTFFQVSSGRSSIGIAGAPMPALLNSTSRRPNASLVFANSALIDAGIADVGGDHQALRAEGVAFARRLVELVLAAAGEDDGIAFLHQRQRDRLADAGTGARYQRNLLQRCHSMLLPS